MALKREFVPLETLVGAEQLNKADGFDLDSFSYSTTVRGKSLEWLCLSRRLLWMASGHEHIEPELLDWIDCIPQGEVLYDIGASNGIFALYAAACGLRVIAIEPDPMNYFLLSYNNYLNSRSTGVALEGCYNLAISAAMAVGRIHIKRMELGGHEKILDKPRDVFGQAFQPEYSHPVLKCALDDLSGAMGMPSPGYLKIDVDGSEAEVLSGADASLASAKSVFIELTQEFMDAFAMSFFASRGYTLKSRVQVQNYDGLYNCIFEKGGS
ncbi:FkbM family methyltransferase [Sideroxydans lithotrophicus]|uniref:Methyltransferase FkbM family n=1 Tax=Sideroxydans lithotrophicus (strain ES-1) TaxID=580332 RepID=D5CN11_SIDLE|nr:FkbM family methyltransferase [Sideroxydans lithotrophicus]ADE10847.1 methyltransferase FkbM family [Sideroxydans lithotrophicus ES-1]